MKLKEMSVETETLHEHPEFQLPRLTEPKYEQVKRSIAHMGQRDPIEVMPDMTIIDGRHRWRAAKELGFKMVKVVVRQDLADADDATIRMRMRQANFERSHGSLLEQVVAVIAIQKQGGEIDCDVIAASKRHIRRLRKIAEGPQELLDAVLHTSETGITDLLAYKILAAKPKVQAACLRAIGRSGDVADKVMQILEKDCEQTRQSKPAKAIRPEQMTASCDVLAAFLGEMRYAPIGEASSKLQAARNAIDRVLALPKPPQPMLRPPATQDDVEEHGDE